MMQNSFNDSIPVQCMLHKTGQLSTGRLIKGTQTYFMRTNKFNALKQVICIQTAWMHPTVLININSFNVHDTNQEQCLQGRLKVYKHCLCEQTSPMYMLQCKREIGVNAFTPTCLVLLDFLYTCGYL